MKRFVDGKTRARVRRGWRGCLLAVGFGVALAGCPRDVSEPDRPSGRSCSEDVDCRPAGAPCGLVFACVDNVCEEESSRTEPCMDR
ncbi:MAG: hypothetical protein AAGE52_09715 [Myxococcota bacterium]